MSLGPSTSPFHFVAPAAYVLWVPAPVLPPLLVDGLCIDVTGGVVGPVSPMARITVQ